MAYPRLDVTGLNTLLTRLVTDGDTRWAKKTDLASASANGLMSSADFTKLSGIETGAQVNVLESVTVNGSVLPVAGKNVSITVPTKTSDLTNDSDYQTGTEVDAAIASAITAAYKPAGTKTVAELVSALLIADNLGNVYNMTDAGTTTADFIEGAGKPIRIGDNVGICDIGTGGTHDYKFDLLSGFVDTSDFVTTGDMTTIDNATIISAVDTAFGIS